MIEIPGQDYTTYDIPDEYHVRAPEHWEGWLILQNPVHNDSDGSITGTILKTVKTPVEEESEDQTPTDSIETLDVRLLPKGEEVVAEGGTIEVGASETVGTAEALQ